MSSTSWDRIKEICEKAELSYGNYNLANVSLGQYADSYGLVNTGYSHEGYSIAVNAAPFESVSNYQPTKEEIDNEIRRLSLGNQKPSQEKKVPSMTVKRVIYNDPATIILWDDGTKTIVKCSQDMTYSEYGGFCAAVAKRVYGSNNGIRKAAGLPKEKRVKKAVVSELVLSPIVEDEVLEGTITVMSCTTAGGGQMEETKVLN